MIVGTSEASPLEIALNSALLEMTWVESVEVRRRVSVEVVVRGGEFERRQVKTKVDEFNQTFPDEQVSLGIRVR
jgi:hypothetical protein